MEEDNFVFDFLENGRILNFFGLMEIDINFRENGRQPNCSGKWTAQINIHFESL